MYTDILGCCLNIPLCVSTDHSSLINAIVNRAMGKWYKNWTIVPMLCIVIHFLVFLFIQIVSCVRYGFRSRRTLPQEYRAEQLRALWKMIEENGEKLFQALWQDLHKVGEVFPVLSIFPSPL